MNRKGFTLIEILVVVMILIILGMGILTILNPMTQILKGYDTVRKTDLAKLKAAFESYYEDHGCYPEQSLLENCGGDDLDPYINPIPCDPSTKEPYLLYYYPQSSCPQNFVVYTELTNIFDPSGSNIPYCDHYYAVYSPGTNETIVVAGCSGREICSRLYGCVSGACTLIAEDSFPLCYPSYCEDPTCNLRCDNPSYECIAN
ncbi:MAG: hypothetical protein UX12_C0033G0004 [Candidatus Collierbacteria bacterium GW2011_GWC1_45_47]|uniref:Type II secretion system protein G n=4 Tax=Candidatus Collieribacteriota TaxID=1752725 RepID=A0A0G1HG20_9BACT|nr:MAG: hypothetical protein UW23_C0004G0002 [Candidatus Collierbacteria bacterium GW2011_GWA1_44_12]KKT39202.1 MAG: hypothetical protein UW26_C0007G0019 [Candidatus Collierbacteria bacterium GW2011_GWF1_44_12]KKT45830.1 MAG: hypothetical protein UW35_C0030G0008 [Candidatus Collierbacteria bacterium GW2011_GWF2_44_15]KKT96418.1 MAG: hypothetical protein UW99_C0059G0004 [Candidatus Collierbacteria bacterium GW2011_GWC2_45_15]KKU08754.1 MAG: hypothetical protein UX12_C0033G0004 [Candidatus Collie